MGNSRKTTVGECEITKSVVKIGVNEVARDTEPDLVGQFKRFCGFCRQLEI